MEEEDGVYFGSCPLNVLQAHEKFNLRGRRVPLKVGEREKRTV